jgi:hypothetical protein
VSSRPRARTTDSLQRVLDEERRWASVMTAPDSRTVTLAPTGPGAPALAAEVHYDPATGRALLFAQGFTAPNARDYELWAITAGRVRRARRRARGPDGRAVVRLERIARDGAVAAFAVSLEATGGSPDPHKPSGPWSCSQARRLTACDDARPLRPAVLGPRTARGVLGRAVRSPVSARCPATRTAARR